MIFNTTMMQFSCKEAQDFADKIIFQNTGKHLVDVEITVFQGAWANKTYLEIATESSYSNEYLNKDAGNKLWKKLSNALGEKVTKTNFKEALRRKWEKLKGTSGNPSSQFSVSLSGIELSFPEGSVPLDSSFYVERPPIESECYQEILKPGSLIRIKAPQQMGKTSLINRILDFGVRQGDGFAVALNLLEADQEVLTSLDKFLRWFCGDVGEHLNLEEELDKRWKTFRSSNQNCTRYFEQYLLPKINCPLFLALDEIDRIFSYPDIASDFSALLRLWHEKAKNNQLWKQLRLVLAYSTEVYIPLNINQSPFNVGRPMNLPELTSELVGNLAHCHRLDWDKSQIEELMGMVGGHPYLVRLAMYHISRQEVTLEKLLLKAATNEGIYNAHLRRLLRNLRQNLELAKAFKKAVTQDTGVELDPTQIYKLYSLGLVKQEGNLVKPRCQLYCQYFARVL